MQCLNNSAVGIGSQGSQGPYAYPVMCGIQREAPKKGKALKSGFNLRSDELTIREIKKHTYRYSNKLLYMLSMRLHCLPGAD